MPSSCCVVWLDDVTSSLNPTLYFEPEHLWIEQCRATAPRTRSPKSRTSHQSHGPKLGMAGTYNTYFPNTKEKVRWLFDHGTTLKKVSDNLSKSERSALLELKNSSNRLLNNIRILDKDSRFAMINSLHYKAIQSDPSIKPLSQVGKRCSKISALAEFVLQPRSSQKTTNFRKEHHWPTEEDTGTKLK